MTKAICTVLLLLVVAAAVHAEHYGKSITTDSAAVAAANEITGFGEHLIFQLIVRAEKRWRRINAPHLVTKVLEGMKFTDGIEDRTDTNNQAEKHAA